MADIDVNNPFTQMQRNYYEPETPNMVDKGGPGGHRQHDPNPDYWGILLNDLLQGDWSDKVGLDFGCGCGRNVLNVVQRVKIKEMHGCDISSQNISYCNWYLNQHRFNNYKFFHTNGVELNGLESNFYDFVCSTIVFQHISVYSVRTSIQKDIARVLKPGGVFSLQMAFGPGHPSPSEYFRDWWDCPGTNSGFDVQILDPKVLENHLLETGFSSVTTVVRPAWEDPNHSSWIYARAVK
jgi:SAM-dependent methyltransferase